VSARRGLSEQEARWFFQQLIIALDFCHRMVRQQQGLQSSTDQCVACCGASMRGSLPGRPAHAAALHPRLQGVSNRDIKLENTLLDGGEWPAIKAGWRAGEAYPALTPGTCRAAAAVRLPTSPPAPAAPLPFPPSLAALTPRSWQTLASARTAARRAHPPAASAPPPTWRLRWCSRGQASPTTAPRRTCGPAACCCTPWWRISTPSGACGAAAGAAAWPAVGGSAQHAAARPVCPACAQPTPLLNPPSLTSTHGSTWEFPLQAKGGCGAAARHGPEKHAAAHPASRVFLPSRPPLQVGPLRLLGAQRGGGRGHRGCLAVPRDAFQPWGWAGHLTLRPACSCVRCAASWPCSRRSSSAA
jgi:serine/threonine protein kinase